ncbi:MAG: hypothetical protein IJO32_00415 [Bacilli bacterium]|nr:hypothetical protein [Bacilli bacterium]
MIDSEKLKKLNEEIESIELKRKDKETGETKITQYVDVSKRIEAFRELIPNGTIFTEIVHESDETINNQTIHSIRFKASVYDENDKILAIAHAEEKNNTYINRTSLIENCETSAVGRALGFLGIGIKKGIASSEEMQKVIAEQNKFEIYENMYISEPEAKKIIVSTLAELSRKFGLRKADLEQKINEKLWTSLDKLDVHQLLRLETKLKTVNMQNDEWHDIYNQNLKIKNVVPEDQEVSYKSSHHKFGEIALQKANDNEMLKNDIIDYYLNAGINLAGD